MRLNGPLLSELRDSALPSKYRMKVLNLISPLQLLLFSGGLLFSISAWSQDSTLSQFEGLEWEVAYFGEFATHPGIKAGISFPFGHTLRVKEKVKNYGASYQITKKRQWTVGSNLIFYHQPNNHNGYLVNVEVGRRRIKHKSINRRKYTLWAWELGVGYYRYQLLGNTFRPVENGFEAINGNGNAIMPSLALQWGRNLKSDNPHPGFIYVKIHSLYEIPYGTGFQMRLALESGVIFPFPQKKLSPSNPNP